jgi:uncharacterized protein YndB with AHSA1/START domain
MPTIQLSNEIQAPVATIWGILADFPNIADWNSGVKKSYATGEQAEGVGASRHCDLAPSGTLEETIREWQPNEKMVVSIDSSTKSPLKSGLGTFELSAGGSESTTVALNLDYELKWGPIGKLIGPVVQRQLTKGFEGALSDLEATATSKL